MLKSLSTLTACVFLTTGCDYPLGTTGQDTSFERVGALTCETFDPATQPLVQGTTTDPVRCGPQSQSLPR